MRTNYLMKIGAVTAAIALVITGSWYTVHQMERQTTQANAPANNKQVIILDAGHGGSF